MIGFFIKARKNLLVIREARKNPSLWVQEITWEALSAPLILVGIILVVFVLGLGLAAYWWLGFLIVRIVFWTGLALLVMWWFGIWLVRRLFSRIIDQMRQSVRSRGATPRY